MNRKAIENAYDKIDVLFATSRRATPSWLCRAVNGPETRRVLRRTNLAEPPDVLEPNSSQGSVGAAASEDHRPRPVQAAPIVAIDLNAPADSFAMVLGGGIERRVPEPYDHLG